MSIRRSIVSVAVVALALTLPVTAAQKMYGADKYDKSTEITLKGTVASIERHQGEKRAPGLHLMLQTAKELIEVQVAPASFLDERQVRFTKGEEIEVIGSKVVFNDEKVVLAREVKTLATTIVVRDESGQPVWGAAANVR